MVYFLDMLSLCELQDLLGFTGALFTLCNNKEGNDHICERLDHFMANFGWINFYLEGTVRHGLVAYSDHLPLWLDIEGLQVST